MYEIGFPQKVYSGLDSVEKLPEILKEKKIQKVLVMTDQGVYPQKAFQKVLSLLEAYDPMCIHNIPPEPSVYDIAKVYEEARRAEIEAIVAVGGGSVMDMTKMVAACLTNPEYVEDVQDTGRIQNPPAKTFMIPTTAGTGAEATPNAIFLFPEQNLKIGIVSPAFVASYVILDGKMTESLPASLTASTGIDALCHAVEAYTNHTYNSKLENKLAEDAVRLIYNNLYKAYCDGSDIEARQNMQKAAFYAGRAFTRGCVGYVHAVGHTLGGLYGTPHGLAMSVILPHVMRQFGSAAHERLARLAEVCQMTGKNDAEKAEKFISWIEELKEKMDIPVGLDVIKDEDIPQIISWAMKEANPLYPTPVYWTEPDFRKLLETIRQ